jgi:hypothetical protein
MRSVRPVSLFALALATGGCIESRLSVDLLTQLHADGSCTRRTIYRLERVDTEKADARVAIPAGDDPFLREYRFPAGEPWQRSDETEVGLHVVTLEALLPSPQAVDGDFFRARTPRAQPARNSVSASADVEHGVYEYQEVLRDPSSPLAAARLLSREALRRDGAFAESLAAALAGKPVALREPDVRRAYRQLLAEPFAREVAALAERPLYGPRERRELDELFDRLNGRQKVLAGRIASLTAGAGADEIDAATESAFNHVGEGLLEQVQEAGLPLLTPDGADRMRFRATLVMPLPILRANACVSGDTASWEFEEVDLFGRGFEMHALAAAR